MRADLFARASPRIMRAAGTAAAINAWQMLPVDARRASPATFTYLPQSLCDEARLQGRDMRHYRPTPMIPTT